MASKDMLRTPQFSWRSPMEVIWGSRINSHLNETRHLRSPNSGGVRVWEANDLAVFCSDLLGE